jgi:hypothetical protein
MWWFPLRFHTCLADLEASIDQALKQDLCDFWRICDHRGRTATKLAPSDEFPKEGHRAIRS